MAQLRRKHRLVPLLHLGHHGQPQGRVVQPPLHGAAFLHRLHHRRPGSVGARQRAAGGAAVPRQRLGHPLRGGDVRRQAGAARPQSVGREHVPAAARGALQLLARRTHGVAGPVRLHRTQPRIAGPVRDRTQAPGHRRLGLPARHDREVRDAVRRLCDPCLGHVRNQPARQHRHAAGQAPRRNAAAALRPAGQAGARDLWRGHRDLRRGRQAAAARRQGFRRPEGARPLGGQRLLPQRGWRGAGR